MTYVAHYVLITCLYLIFLILTKKQRTIRNLLVHFTMLVYILIVLSITVIPLPNVLHPKNEQFLQSVNLLPFRDIIHGYAFAKQEALFNIFMMIPFGFLFPLITKKNLLQTVLITFSFSLTIETIQLLTVLFDRVNARTFDITDLITNTTGGLIGYIIFKIFHKKYLSGF